MYNSMPAIYTFPRTCVRCVPFGVFFYKIVTKKVLRSRQLDLIIVVQIWPKPVGRYMPNCLLPKKAKQ